VTRSIKDTSTHSRCARTRVKRRNGMKRKRVKHPLGAPPLSYFTKEETRQAVGVL
jgi:hypothetical protein